MGETVFFEISLVLIVCAILSWCALLLRQPIVVAYLAGGLLIGTSGLGWIKDITFINEISRIGITLLLFLAGIVLHPRRLKELLRQTILLTLTNSLISGAVCVLFCRIWGFDLRSSLFIGLPLIFSSTILVIKLLPTTALHHKRMGSYCIAILIAQDLIAIVLLVLMGAGHGESASLTHWLLLPLKAIALTAAVFGFEQIILRRIMARCNRFHETLHLLSLGWCLGVAIIAEHIGLSHEIGAFLAGVALARSPLSFFLSEGLRPFRDFFLVFFFFALGTQINLTLARAVVLPALLLTVLMMAVKYAVFRKLFRVVGESGPFAHETGLRLAQASEFSLIVAVAAYADGWLGDSAYMMIQLVTVFSLIISAYIVVARVPSPLASNPKLKQD